MEAQLGGVVLGRGLQVDDHHALALWLGRQLPDELVVLQHFQRAAEKDGQIAPLRVLHRGGEVGGRDRLAEIDDGVAQLGAVAHLALARALSPMPVERALPGHVKWTHVLLAAARASLAEDVTVQLAQLARRHARAQVQPVDVLRDYLLDQALAHQRRERQVPYRRPRLRKALPHDRPRRARRVACPPRGGAAAAALFIVQRPQSLWAAIVRDRRGCAHPCTRINDRVLCLTQHVGQRSDLNAKCGFVLLHLGRIDLLLLLHPGSFGSRRT